MCWAVVVVVAAADDDVESTDTLQALPAPVGKIYTRDTCALLPRLNLSPRRRRRIQQRDVANVTRAYKEKQ